VRYSRRRERGAVGVEGIGNEDPLPHSTTGLGEHRELPQWGPGQSPSGKRIWCILSVKFFKLIIIGINKFHVALNNFLLNIFLFCLFNMTVNK